MTTTNPLTPATCTNCCSSQIVPVIEGHPEGDLMTLVFQGKLALCGSFAISDGSAIWACSECGERVLDEKYCYDSNNLELVDTYNRTVNAVFDDFVSLEEADVRKLKGLSFLKGLARSYLENGHEIFFIESQNGDFQVSFGVSNENSAEQNSLLTEDRVAQMFEFIGDKRRAEFAIRIKKKEIKVFAEPQSAPLRIRIEKMS